MPDQKVRKVQNDDTFVIDGIEYYFGPSSTDLFNTKINLGEFNGTISVYDSFNNEPHELDASDVLKAVIEAQTKEQ